MKTKPNTEAAITILEIAYNIMTNNAPINRAKGNIEQADMEDANAEQIKTALEILNITQ